MRAVSDRTFYIFTAVLSAGAVAFLGYLLFIHPGAAGDPTAYSFLPAINAVLNGTSALLLVSGWVAIRRGLKNIHPYFMVGAFFTSTLFFISYVIYHYFHGDTHFGGTGPIRMLYFFILSTHILLSTLVVPMALLAFYFAARKTFQRHKRVTRWALPIWLYVSVTGVMIFFLLRGSLPSSP